MGLRDDLQADLSDAFDTDLADAVTQFTGARVLGQGPYDPITETRPTITETYTGRGVFGSFSLRLVDGINILATDIKLTALQSEVTDTPRVDDAINGYRVIGPISQDPAKATWVIQLRKV